MTGVFPGNMQKRTKKENSKRGILKPDAIPRDPDQRGVNEQGRAGATLHMGCVILLRKVVAQEAIADERSSAHVGAQQFRQQKRSLRADLENTRSALRRTQATSNC